MDGAVQQLTGMDKIALRGLFDLSDLQLGVAADKITVVSDLAAHLCIERGTVQHDQHAVLGLACLVGGDGVNQFLTIGQGQDLGLLAQGLVAVKLGGIGGQLAEQVSAPTGNILGQALGAGALAVALGVFGAVLAVAGRLPLGPAPLAATWAGIVLGSLPLYALGLGLALRFGRNAAIGAGAAGVLLAFFSVGGLAHGLMTGELTGALATPLSWVPLAWPARLGSLGVEAFIDAARAAGPLLTTALAGLVLALAAAAVLLAWFRRFEDGRADA